MTQPQNVFDVLERFREALLKQDEFALRRLIDNYRIIYGRLADKIDALLLEIDAKGGVTRGQLVRMQRYKDLAKQTAEELQRFGALTEAELFNAERVGIELGNAHARGVLSALTPGTRATFNTLPTEAIQTLTGFLAPQSPLLNRVRQLAPITTDLVLETLQEAVALGYNPRKTAGILRSAYGQGLTDSLRMTRTVQLYSYREATRATYITNGVEKWIWSAKLDDRTCMSCVAMHGSIHPVTERLNDHYNGRCAMVPVVEPFGPIIKDGAGEEWFNKQSQERQIKMMGKGKYEAWQAGEFGIGDLSTGRQDAVYGEMRTVPPLKDLIGKGATTNADIDEPFVYRELLPRDEVRWPSNSIPKYNEMSDKWINNLDEKELKAVQDYTGPLYGRMNDNIKWGELGERELSFLSAAEKAPIVNGEILWRGINPKSGYDTVQEYLERMRGRIGQTLTWDVFSSASLDAEMASQFGNTVFEIKSKTARYINSGSKYYKTDKDESEAVFMPGSTFRIIDVFRGTFSTLFGQEERWIIQLEEI